MSLLRRTGKCGLRDYGLAPSIWGGWEDCEHEWAEHFQPAANGIIHPGGMSGETLSGNSATRKPKTSSFCACGAWLGILGLEPTLEMYVEHIVEVFREARRVLRKDGTLWLNMGDSYASQGGPPPVQTINPNRAGGSNSQNSGKSRTVVSGLKPKDLCGIPWRVAFALQADGWWLRSDIIWAKPNPMPESVTDRPTRSHEYIFLLTKSERYYYDQDAVREPNLEASVDRYKDKTGLTIPEAWKRNEIPISGGKKDNWNLNPAGRNIRSVWTIPTQPFPDAHFATFPEELAERCIKAGTSEKGCCAKCGAPWVRIIERIVHPPTDRINNNQFKHDPMTTHGEGASTLRCEVEHRYGGKWAETDPQSSGRRILANTKAARDNGGDYDNPFVPTKTLGWKPSCKCGTDERQPCVVLDPFSGAGTTVLVADKLGRHGIGIELKPDYAQMAQRRVYADCPLLNHPTEFP